MAADLKTLKSSLRIDGNDDDELLKGYLSAATSYIKQAIGDENSVPGFYEMEKRE
ncbi:DNA packaging protein [Lactiplantibacillus plantarum]|nr:DNA packaging protein [Lactiplantibacillus plantarum]